MEAQMPSSATWPIRATVVGGARRPRVRRRSRSLTRFLFEESAQPDAKQTLPACRSSRSPPRTHCSTRRSLRAKVDQQLLNDSGATTHVTWTGAAVSSAAAAAALPAKRALCSSFLARGVGAPVDQHIAAMPTGFSEPGADVKTDDDGATFKPKPPEASDVNMKNTVFDPETFVDKMKHFGGKITDFFEPTGVEDYAMLIGGGFAVSLVLVGCAVLASRSGGQQAEPQNGAGDVEAPVDGQAAVETDATATGSAAVAEPPRATGEETEEEQRTRLNGYTVQELEAREAARQADAQANSGVALVYERVMPAVLQGDRVQNVMNRRVEASRQRLQEVINQELTGGIDDLQNIVAGALPEVNMLRQDGQSVSMMLAGLLAPGQLKWLHADNLSRLGFGSLLLFLDLLSLHLGWGRPCISYEVWGMGTMDTLHGWMGVDATMLGFTVAVAVNIHQQCVKTLKEVEEIQQDVPTDLPADPEQAFRVQMEHQLMAGAKAMLVYDRLTLSGTYRLLPVLAVADFFWQTAGWFIYLDTPSATCDAKTLLYWSRGRGIIFLIGLVPSIVSLGMTVVKIAVQSPSVGSAVLEGAVQADKSLFPHGPAVFTILVRAVWVRDVTDMAKMELQVVQAEQRQMERERDQKREQMRTLERELSALEARTQAAAARSHAQEEVLHTDAVEREFMAQYREAVGQALDTRHNLQVVLEAGQQGGAAAAFQAYAKQGALSPQPAAASSAAGTTAVAAPAPPPPPAAVPPTASNVGPAAADPTLDPYTNQILEQEVDNDGGTGSSLPRPSVGAVPVQGAPAVAAPPPPPPPKAPPGGAQPPEGGVGSGAI